MRPATRGVLLFCLVCPPTLAGAATTASYYPTRLDDAKAVYLTREAFPAVHADGRGDDSEALQQAIDRLQETNKQGVVFIPEGTYRLSRTIHVYTGIRLIGYGKRRPVLLLGEKTPGFQEGTGKYMVHFTSWRPRAGEAIRDGNPGTFYSAMSNIDIEIREGNPAAIGVRFHVAQHCYLAHMSFRIGGGRAGLEDIGNVGEDLHFYGGEYGIVTRKTAPSWPYVLLDSTFSGQRQAAIQSHEAGLTIIRNRFRGVPKVVAIDPERSEELWISDSRFEDVSGPAITISNIGSPRTQINLKNVVCRKVPVLARLRESGREIAGPGALYLVKEMSHGLKIADGGALGQIQTTHDLEALAKDPEPVPTDIRVLPAPSSWVNVRTLGAKGDGTTDDTAALKDAIAKHRAIYLPSGRYRVSDTLALKPDTVLVGLSPSATVVALDDATPGYEGPGAPKALLEAPKGGTNIVTGIGLDTGGNNPRAVAALWKAGALSMMSDVRFHGGHGSYRLDGTWEELRRHWEKVYNSSHSADPDAKRRWDSQYPSLWVTDGGGGTFLDLWTPSTFAQAGAYISDTQTPGRIYAMSVEHHVRNEVKLKNVAHWEIYGLQLEEEWGESATALPLEIDQVKDVMFANLFIYRVVGSATPFPYAVKVTASDVRFRGLHTYSDSKVAFDTNVYDATHDVEIRDRELGTLILSANAPRLHASSGRSAGEAPLARLVGGFINISGAAVAPNGDLYFVEPKRQSVYRWSVAEERLSLVHDAPLEPTQLAFDRAGNLLVVSYGGKGAVYALRPDAPFGTVTLLEAQKATPRAGLTPVLPVARWRNENDFVTDSSAARPFHYVSPDGSTFVPAGKDFVSGELYYGVKMADILRAFALAPATPGKPFYVCDESEQRLYRFTVGDDGSLADGKLLAEEGGTAVAVGPDGKIYVAAGQVLVYDGAGKRLGTIEVPERPTGLVFGGPDRGTLFILSRHTLYSIRPS